jgi:hypothetical protein
MSWPEGIWIELQVSKEIPGFHQKGHYMATEEKNKLLIY